MTEGTGNRPMDYIRSTLGQARTLKPCLYIFDTCAHKIHVLYYPAHTTHIYQGLNVIVFSVLKQYWAEERTKWEVNGGEVLKKTFLTIYSAAHIWALGPALVKKAFEKTSIWLFNPNIIPAEMMAPSKETSWKGHLPFSQSTPMFKSSVVHPIHIAAQWLEHVLQLPTESTALSIILDNIDNITATIDSATHQLQDPATDYLAWNSPIKPAAQLPPSQPLCFPQSNSNFLGFSNMMQQHHWREN